MNSAYEWVNKRTRPAKPNNKTMDYRVTTDILESIDKGDLLKKSRYKSDIFIHRPTKKKFALDSLLRNPDWFEPVEEVQEGQYWEDDYGNIGRVQVVYESDVEIKSIDEEAVNTYDKSFFIDRARKLSTDEIEQAIKKEAKRRDYLEDNFEPIEPPGKPVFEDYDEWYYNEEKDILFTAPYGNGGYTIYKQGEFAKIVDQTPTIEINGNKVEFNDHPKVGCTTIKKEVFIEQAKTIARHGVRIHRKGEDITDQILAIASHYGYEDEIKYRAGDTIIMGTLEDVTFSDQNMWGNND